MIERRFYLTLIPKYVIKSTMKNNTQSLPYCGKIAARVIENERAGVSKKANFDSIQTFQYAPKSMTTFYKLYRQDMDSVHADTVREIGSKVVDQAKQGDFKSQELYLRSKGGWSPQNTENIVEEKDADSSALEKLMMLLGKS